jgi:hypothetical protein
VQAAEFATDDGAAAVTEHVDEAKASRSAKLIFGRRGGVDTMEETAGAGEDMMWWYQVVSLCLGNGKSTKAVAVQVGLCMSKQTDASLVCKAWSQVQFRMIFPNRIRQRSRLLRVKETTFTAESNKKAICL